MGAICAGEAPPLQPRQARFYTAYLILILINYTHVIIVYCTTCPLILLFSLPNTVNSPQLSFFSSDLTMHQSKENRITYKKRN